MSRRIETGTKTPMLGANDVPDNYLGRLVGYIPTEIIGLYLAVNAPIPKSNGGYWTALWWVFGACWSLTPLYLWFATYDKTKGPLIPQIILATIAFPVWVFAIGGPFLSLPWYKGYIATIVLCFVTFVLGWYKPKVGS